MFTFRVDVAAAEFAQRLQFYERGVADELGAAATGPVVLVFTAAAASSQRYCYDRCECCSSSDGGGAHLSLGFFRCAAARAHILYDNKMTAFLAALALQLCQIGRNSSCLLASALQALAHAPGDS